MYHANTKQKKARIAILIWDSQFQSKESYRGKENIT